MKIQKTLAFGAEEYARRLERVRRTMAERGIDCLLVHGPENICYLSGFHTSGYYFVQMLLVPRDAEPCLVVRRYEQGNVDAFSWLKREQSITYLDDDDPIAVIAHRLADLGFERGRLGIDMQGFYLSIARYEALKRAPW